MICPQCGGTMSNLEYWNEDGPVNFYSLWICRECNRQTIEQFKMR